MSKNIHFTTFFHMGKIMKILKINEYSLTNY